MASTTSQPNHPQSARHWGVLRAALTKRSRTKSGETASSIATQFFPRYVPTRLEELPAELPDVPFPFCWVSYDLSASTMTQKDQENVLYVREKRPDQAGRVSVSELLSHHENAGVDNTGNIRTWPAESLLLSYLLEEKICESIVDATGKASLDVCELGSGMAGLAAFGLLLKAPTAFGRMLVTDGNAQCVQNLRLCAQANTKRFSSKTKISTEVLRWSREEAEHMPNDYRHCFDMILASDCLFFEDFHEDLACTIKALLKPGTGKAYLMQPSRNGSMERFCAFAKAAGLQVRQDASFDSKLEREHFAYMKQRQDYCPDVHRPRLLVVSATGQ